MGIRIMLFAFFPFLGGFYRGCGCPYEIYERVQA